MTNGKKSAPAKKKRKLDFAKPRTLLRKHARIKKNGRVELKKGWSDKKIAKKAKAEVELVRRLRGDLYDRIRGEVVRHVFGNKVLQIRRAPGREAGTFFIPPRSSGLEKPALLSATGALTAISCRVQPASSTR